MKHPAADCLRDMIEESRLARKFVGDMSFEAFVENDMAAHATVRASANTTNTGTISVVASMRVTTRYL